MVISQYTQNIKVNAATEDVSVATTPKAEGPYVKVNTQPVTYVGSGTAYTPIGTLDPSEMLRKGPDGFNIGDVINVSKDFTTDWRFVEGEGKDYPPGTNVVVIEHDGRKVFDVLGGFIDLRKYDSQYEQLKNEKADITYVNNKVSSAISSVYRVRGSISPISITQATLESSEIGDVYNVTGAFNTSSFLFVDDYEGNKTYPKGTNIVVVNMFGTKMFDVLAGPVVLDDYYNKTQVDALASGKLDKYSGPNTTSTLLYARLPDNTNGVVNASTGPSNAGVPLYSELGTLKVLDAFEDYDCVNLKKLNTLINAKLSSVYKPKGIIPADVLMYTNPAILEVGDVYNVNGTFMTNEHFIEGVIGTVHPSGSNVVVVLNADNVKKWDILGSTVDLSEYPTIAQLGEVVTNLLNELDKKQNAIEIIG